mgnify:FL=1|jgi:hypothetical protein
MLRIVMDVDRPVGQAIGEHRPGAAAYHGGGLPPVGGAVPAEGI